MFQTLQISKRLPPRANSTKYNTNSPCNNFVIHQWRLSSLPLSLEPCFKNRFQNPFKIHRDPGDQCPRRCVILAYIGEGKAVSPTADGTTRRCVKKHRWLVRNLIEQIRIRRCTRERDPRRREFLRRIGCDVVETKVSGAATAARSVPFSSFCPFGSCLRKRRTLSPTRRDNCAHHRRVIDHYEHEAQNAGINPTINHRLAGYNVPSRAEDRFVSICSDVFGRCWSSRHFDDDDDPPRPTTPPRTFGSPFPRICNANRFPGKM